jgi:predicted phosphodiesterase
LKIGVISDTHGYLDPRVEKIFAGVNHILHAGDIGFASIILELQFIAPVTAVLGNTDGDPGFRLTEVVALAEKKFLVHHIVNRGRGPKRWTKAS